MSEQLHSHGDIEVGHKWVHGDDAADLNTNLDTEEGTTNIVKRGIRVGDVTTTGSVLYLVRHPGGTEEKVTDNALAGEVFVLDFYRVGSSTTCEDLTALY